MNMQMIPLSQIDVGQRLRAIDPDNAAVIAASMQEIGQRQPIEVRKPHRHDSLSLISAEFCEKSLKPLFESGSKNEGAAESAV